MALKFFLNFLLAMALMTTAVAAPSAVWAQGNGVGQSEAPKLTGTRKQLATIIFSGLAGAILGLSTLSFYGRPQDHLSNIAVGFAFGIISGTIYTTYQAARAPYEYYDIGQLQKWQPSYVIGSSNTFGSPQHLEQTLAPRMGYTWTF